MSVLTDICRAGIVLFATVFAASAVELFPIKDVRPGLKGVGKTVFTGTTVEEFNVEILGVLENSGPKQAIILARLSGGPLERTGVMQGMSGSPVYIDGKLVGAVAMAFPFSKEPIAGIRPIGEMLNSAPAQSANRRAAVTLQDTNLLAGFHVEDATPASDRLVNIRTPISFSGFTQATLAHFGQQLQRIGLEPMQGLSGGAAPGGRSSAPSKPLEPGSMISVQLVSGDMSIGADGTVTHLDGNRVYAFGHHFLSLGQTELPFTRASVITLLPNVNTSFKISSSGDWLGAMTSDVNPAISGELGRKPRMVPVSISVDGAGQSQRYRMEMVQDKLLSPLMLQMLVYSVLDATERTLGTGSISIKGKVELEGIAEPLRLDNVFAGDYNVPLQASMATALPISYALQNTLGAAQIRSVEIALQAHTAKKQVTIDQLWSSRRDVRPGETVELKVALSTEGGGESIQTLSYQVPIGSTPGPLYFTAADGPTINAAELKHLSLMQPQPLHRTVAFLNSMKGSNRGLVRVWRQNTAYNIDGRDLPDPPPSLGLLLARGAPTTNAIPRTSTVAELPFANGDAVVNGSKTIQVDVKE